MKTKFNWIFITLLCCLAFRTVAAERNGLRFYHLGQEDGLSHSTVFSINQDRKGYMWFATSDGLNKFNGYNFTVYRHAYGDSTSIASNTSRCIMVDGSGRIWVGTSEGLSLYDSDKERFVNYYISRKGKHVAVVNIVQMQRGKLLLGTPEGVFVFDIAQRQFLDDVLPQAMQELKNAAMVRQADRIYIGASRGLYEYAPHDKMFRQLAVLESSENVQTVFCQEMDRIWVATEGGGLFLYNKISKKLKNYYLGDESGLRSNFVRSLALDPDDQLWVGTYSGLYIFRENTGQFDLLSEQSESEGDLSQNSVRCIFKDAQGGMWLGTYWGGVNYYHPLCNRFRHIKHIPFVNSLSDNVVSCIAEDVDGNLWIGTSGGGLNFYDRKNNHFQVYSPEVGVKGISFKDIKCIYIDEAHDKLYVGAHAGGMMILDRKTGRREYLNMKNKGLPTNNIYSILPDGNGGLWIAALEYLLHYDITQKSFSVVEKGGTGEGTLRRRLLFRDSNNTLWMGGERGVTAYRSNGKALEKKSMEGVPVLLNQSFISCFYESASGKLWIGTNNGLFGVKNKEYFHYTTNDGLSSNVIYGIMEDVFGRLWISTNQGLSCMDSKSGSFRNFTMQDGLQSNQFNAGSFCRTTSGEMLVGGVNGITSFIPETLVDNPYAPQPIIDRLQVFNKEILPDDGTGILSESIEKTESITLDASQNSFSLSFVVPNYIARTHNTFSYKLDGYDKDWFELEDSRTVSYANLPAGVYVFYVKAANNDGKWNEEPASLRIEILPVWYRTWWATTLLVVVLVFLATGAFRFFWSRKSMQAAILMERKDREKMEEVNQMKIRFYVNISHELRTPLTLITAPLQDLLDHVSNYWEREKLTYIQRNTNRLLHLVNQLMDYRRAELGIFKLQLTRSNAYKRVLNCFLNYEHWVKKKDIDYNIYTELQDKDFLFDANYLDLILNNLLSNAVKYTEAGESITVKLYEEGEYLVLQVSDTGVGIPKDKQKKIFERFYQVDSDHPGSGIGLSLIQRLVELHHGRIDLKSEVGKGSTFTVYIPQNESAYTLEELQSNTGNSTEQVAYSTNANDAYVGETMDTDLSADAEDSEKKITILVVEDNEELRNYLVSGLRDLFNVTVAGNGQEALELLKDKEVDLVVTDVMMPVMDGIKLCRQLKQNLRTCHIPVFMLSAKTDVKYQLEGLKVGADDYLPKPFSMSVLRTKIQNTLRTRSRAFERYSNSTEVEPEKIAMNSMDEELLRKAIEVVERNMDNVEFSTEQFASEMNMSRSNLHLKLKAITGKSAIEFIHKIRFNRACQLLKEGKYSIAEISYMVGYNTPSYFAARFKKYMGCLPTEYIKKES